MRFSSRTSTASPASFASAAARSAKTRGVSVLPGSFASVAREVRALAEDAAALERRVNRSRRRRPTRSCTDVEPHALVDRWSCTDAPSKLARTAPRRAPARPARASRWCRGRWIERDARHAALRAARPPVMAARRSRSAVKSFRGPSADQRNARALPAAHGRDEHVVRLALDFAARAAPRQSRRPTPASRSGSSVRVSSSKTGKDQKVRLDVAGGSCGDGDRQVSDERSASMRVCVSRQLACPAAGSRLRIVPARGQSMTDPRRACLHAGCRVAVLPGVALGVQGAADRSQETKFITQGDAAGRLHTACACVRRRGRPRRQRRLRRLLLRRRRVGLGRRHDVRELERLRPVRGRQEHDPPPLHRRAHLPAGGAYRVVFRLKQKTKQVAAASTNVQVRCGVGDGFGR